MNWWKNKERSTRKSDKVIDNKILYNTTHQITYIHEKDDL